MKRTMLLSGVAMAVALAAPLTLHADPGGHSRGHAKHERADVEHERDAHRDGDWRFHNDDRVVIRSYIAERYHRDCPPGLAKKHNGCMPPGKMHRYRSGEVLATNVVWEPVPQDVLVRLHEPYPGTQYVMVDRNVLLINEATKKVLDAITLYSAVQ